MKNCEIAQLTGGEECSESAGGTITINGTEEVDVCLEHLYEVAQVVGEAEKQASQGE